MPSHFGQLIIYIIYGANEGSCLLWTLFRSLLNVEEPTQAMGVKGLLDYYRVHLADRALEFCESFTTKNFGIKKFVFKIFTTKNLAIKNFATKNFEIKSFAIKNFAIKNFTIKNFATKKIATKIFAIKNFATNTDATKILLCRFHSLLCLIHTLQGSK